MAFGGFSTAATTVTEEYDGTSWTAGGSLNTARYALAGAGTQTLGLAFGGYTGTAYSNSTEEYNGTSWAATTNMTTARSELAGCGTQSSALAFGGDTGSATAATEEYTGVIVTATPSILTTS